MRKVIFCSLFCMLLGATLAAEVKMPAFCGHRGDCEFGLQNTMSAYQAAWRNGITWVEIDVRTTADGKLICFHDADLSKMANDKRQIRKLTYAELKKIDIGSKKHPMFKNERPPLLEEFFAAMPRNGHVLLELKKHSVNADFPYVLRDMMKKYNIDKSQVTVVSFYEDMLKNLNQKVPGMRNMLIVGLGDCRRLGMKAPSYDAYLALDNILARLKELGCTGFSFAASDRRIKFDKKFIQTIKNAGYEISVWLVNDVWLAYQLAQWGATSVVTDRPVTMKETWEKLFNKK